MGPSHTRVRILLHLMLVIVSTLKIIIIIIIIIIESVEIINKMQPCNRIYYSNVH
jgi:hypothetical protein